MNNTILFITLGCKVNQYDSGALLELFRAKGFEAAGRDCRSPDAVVVNTCVVTAESERKSRQAIRRMRARYPGALLAVTGCYPQQFPQKASQIDGVDFIRGLADREALVTDIALRLAAMGTTSTRGAGGANLPDIGIRRVRAYVKIQDGCNNFCSYCIVPYARGRAHSRDLSAIIEEVDALAARGAQEIVLTGIHISSYGIDFIPTGNNAETGRRGNASDGASATSIANANGGAMTSSDASAISSASAISGASAFNSASASDSTSATSIANANGGAMTSGSRAMTSGSRGNSHDTDHADATGHDTDLGKLVDIVARRLKHLDNRIRLRLSSLEPSVVTPDFVGLLSRNRETLCPHFHLSLQSGCETVLQRMNRKYTPQMYREAVSLIREAFPGAGITTDVIVGFPGESDYEFLQSYEFCRETVFSKIHVFPYSKRLGTKAAEQPGQIDPSVKQSRVKRMIALSNELSLSFNQRYINKYVYVLVESMSNGLLEGLTDNYIRVVIKPPQVRPSVANGMQAENSANGSWAASGDTGTLTTNNGTGYHPMASGVVGLSAASGDTGTLTTNNGTGYHPMASGDTGSLTTNNGTGYHPIASGGTGLIIASGDSSIHAAIGSYVTVHVTEAAASHVTGTIVSGTTVCAETTGLII